MSDIALAAAGVEERGPAPRLINRVRPAPLESLGSLLQRLGEANHYRERTWLGGLLRRHPERPEVLRRVEDFETLEELTGLGRAELIGLTLHRFAPRYGVAQRPPRPVLPAVLPIPLWPDIGARGNTRAAAAVCPACWGEWAVIVLPWWLHHVTACPRHLMLLRQWCAGCDAPLRLAAGQAGCGQCGAAIGAMGTRSIAGDADGKELSALVWWATGCGEGLYPPEEWELAADHPVWELAADHPVWELAADHPVWELAADHPVWELAADHPVWGLGTPALLRGLWGGAQAEVAGAGEPRLHAREIADVHEALVGAWRRLRDGAEGRLEPSSYLDGRYSLGR